MSIDSRIVTMKFDNAQFESGARTSLSTLQKLKDSMNFGSIGTAATKSLGGITGLLNKVGIRNPFASTTKGLQDVGRAAADAGGPSGVGAIEGGISHISKSFLALSTVALTALSNITTKAMQTAQTMVSSLTVSPVKGGLEEYETNLNSIQTILANTKVAGTGLPEVNAALEELNHYSDKTIYNFSEMAKNIGTFTAAGVDLDTSVASIKGIANLAALSGSNSQQASTAMYQLSQEIAAGRVSLMGWNSVVNAGMGGSTFQRALVTTAKEMGTLKGRTVEFKGEMKNATIDGMSFRDSIMAKPGETSWLSKEVLTGTLAQFTGDMTDAELAAEGFSKAQIKDIQQMAKTASDAATKVKTLSGVFDTAKEVVGSGWAKTWQLVFGDFLEAREFFTNFSIGFNDILGGMADRRNEVLSEWKLAGGRDLAIEGLKELWQSLLTILKPVGEAFRDIFPAKTSGDLMTMTRNFIEFAKNLRISKDTAEGLKDTFRGVFAIFSIIGKVIGAVAHGIGTLFGAIGDGSGGLLNFTGGIGNAIVSLNDFLERTDILKEFFGSIGGLISVPIRLITEFAGVLGTMFDSFDAGGAGGAVGAMDKFSGSVDGMATAGERISAIFDGIGKVFSTIGDVIVNALAGIGNAIAGAFTPETFDASLKMINTALLGGIVLMLKRFFSGGLNVDVGGGFFNSIKETLGAATGALQNMQANLKADILLKIAGALGILALSLLLLATIDPKDLTKALVAMGVGFGLLSGALVILTGAISILGAAKLPLIAGSMVLLATSMLILAGAMKIMASMSLGEMLMALLGLGGALFIIGAAMKTMPINMPITAAGLLLLAVAMNALAVALKIFGTMSVEEMAKGLAAMAGSLVIIGLAMHLMPNNMPITAAGLLILSVALNALGTALKIFATMSWEEMAKGLTALAGSLVIIGFAMNMMPLTLPVTAAGLLLVAVALNVMAGALKIMASMSWEEIAKSMVVLAGALGILAIALNLMSGALLGAAALVIAAGALAVLAPILMALGAMSWENILKGLVGLAGVLTILGIAGVLLTPVIPTLLGLGIALTLIGAGLALAGVGALAFATAIGVLVATGTAGIKVLAEALKTVAESIPILAKALGKGFVAFVREIAKNGPELTRAIGKIIGNMLDAVTRNAPKMAKAFLAMLNAALKVITTAAPKIYAAGLDLIIGFLEALNSRIGRIVDLAASIIVKFINGISRNIGKIIQSGVNLIIKFINGVSDAIDNNSERLGNAGGRLAVSMVRGMANGISGAAGAIKDAALQAAEDAWQSVKDKFKIGSPSKLLRDDIGHWMPEGVALGIRDKAHRPVEEFDRMGSMAINTLKRTMAQIEDEFAMSSDLQPTVTPVLDLSQLTREASRMSSILSTSPIDTSVSYAQASDISMENQAAQEAAWEDSSAASTTEIKLEQNNYSPKPIDPITTYRNTKSLLSLAKEALDES